MRLGTLTAVAALLAAAAGGAPGETLAQPAPAGREVYQEHCAVCHGDAGDGRGHYAARFASAPRDFTAGRYKFRSTPSGQLPTDDDLRRSIVQGMPGTAMLPQDQLSSAEVDAVIAVVKAFSSKFADARPAAPLPIRPAPPRSPAAVERGRALYAKAECHECHGREARGDGPSAKDLKVKPADLTRRPFKVGPTPGDVVRALLTGLDGTPMPSYHLILEDEELWLIAYYVDSLATPPRVTDDERIARESMRMHRAHHGRRSGLPPP